MVTVQSGDLFEAEIAPLGRVTARFSRKVHA
jgi:2-keto-4-pentenoate hydratase